MARPPDSLEAKAVVTLVPGTGITGSAITLKGSVPGIEEAKFMELAEKAKANCPVSKALGSIDISLDASPRLRVRPKPALARKQSQRAGGLGHANGLSPRQSHSQPKIRAFGYPSGR